MASPGRSAANAALRVPDRHSGATELSRDELQMIFNVVSQHRMTKKQPKAAQVWRSIASAGGGEGALLSLANAAQLPLSVEMLVLLLTGGARFTSRARLKTLCGARFHDASQKNSCEAKFNGKRVHVGLELADAAATSLATRVAGESVALVALLRTQTPLVLIKKVLGEIIAVRPLLAQTSTKPKRKYSLPTSQAAKAARGRGGGTAGAIARGGNSSDGGDACSLSLSAAVPSSPPPSPSTAAHGTTVAVAAARRHAPSPSPARRRIFVAPQGGAISHVVALHEGERVDAFRERLFDEIEMSDDSDSELRCRPCSALGELGGIAGCGVRFSNIDALQNGDTIVIARGQRCSASSSSASGSAASSSCCTADVVLARMQTSGLAVCGTALADNVAHAVASIVNDGTIEPWFRLIARADADTKLFATLALEALKVYRTAQ